MWEDEKSDALLGNLLPSQEAEPQPEPVPEAPVDPVPVTVPTEEKSS
jgi:hypothetical protein